MTAASNRCRVERHGSTVEFFRGDAEFREAGYLRPNTGQSDEEMIEDSGAFHHYGGPGKTYCRRPYVLRTRTRVLVRWSGGLDI